MRGGIGIGRGHGKGNPHGGGPAILFAPTIGAGGLDPADWEFPQDATTTNTGPLAPAWSITAPSGTSNVDTAIPGEPPTGGLRVLRATVVAREDQSATDYFTVMAIEAIGAWDNLALLDYDRDGRLGRLSVAKRDGSGNFLSSWFALDLEDGADLELAYDLAGAQPVARLHVGGAAVASVTDTSSGTPDEHYFPARFFLLAIPDRWFAGVGVYDGFQGA